MVIFEFFTAKNPPGNPRQECTFYPQLIASKTSRARSSSPGHHRPHVRNFEEVVSRMKLAHKQHQRKLKEQNRIPAGLGGVGEGGGLLAGLIGKWKVRGWKDLRNSCRFVASQKKGVETDFSESLGLLGHSPTRLQRMIWNKKRPSSSQRAVLTHIHIQVEDMKSAFKVSKDSLFFFAYFFSISKPFSCMVGRGGETSQYNFGLIAKVRSMRSWGVLVPSRFPVHSDSIEVNPNPWSMWTWRSWKFRMWQKCFWVGVFFGSIFERWKLKKLGLIYVADYTSLRGRMIWG